MKNILSLLSIATLIFACGSSQTNAPKVETATVKADASVYASSITSAELKEALYTYASDEFEGRETGQPGQKKAIEFLKEHYVALGIPSPIAQGDYFQEVPLEKTGVPQVDLSVNNKTFTYIDDFVSLASGSDGVLNVDEIVNVGYGIVHDNYSSYGDADVKGKVLLMMSGEPKGDDGNYIISGTDEASKWSNMRQQFASKKQIAQDKGASAVLFYYPEVYSMAANRFGRSSGRMALKGVDENMYFFMINTSIVEE